MTIRKKKLQFPIYFVAPAEFEKLIKLQQSELNPFNTYLRPIIIIYNN